MGIGELFYKGGTLEHVVLFTILYLSNKDLAIGCLYSSFLFYFCNFGISDSCECTLPSLLGSTPEPIGWGSISMQFFV